MASLEMVSIEALGQDSNGFYTIDTNECIYTVNNDAKINIKSGAFARIIDQSKNSNILVNVLDGATLEYYLVNGNSNHSFHVYGELRITEISLDATNENLEVVLEKENAVTDIKNLSVLAKEKSYYTQKIIHNDKQTFSNITNVGVAIGGASITFDTTGKIEKGKSKSKCAQLSRGIVMDNDSVIVAKPILLIDEYDCFANHGASIGKMSDEDLFYLMSRGLTKNEAFLLILEGIIRPFINAIPQDEIKESLDNQINSRMHE